MYQPFHLSVVLMFAVSCDGQSQIYYIHGEHICQFFIFYGVFL